MNIVNIATLKEKLSYYIKKVASLVDDPFSLFCKTVFFCDDSVY